MMRAWLAAAPDVHLRVDDLHGSSPHAGRGGRDASNRRGTLWWSRLCWIDLLTNDDGIDAPGLAILEAVAAELAREVWVVAPEHDQSGVSHAISLHHALRVSERGPRRFGISGTPGDCAVMGICHLMTDGAPQLVLSGINRGLNLGMETVFSGTVGGAMTGMMLGVPSIALSQAYKDRNNVSWDASRTLGAKVVRELLAIGWCKDACLNVNFPACDAAEAGPMTLARQGVGMIAGMHVDTRTDPRGMTYHWLNFRARGSAAGAGERLRCAACGKWSLRRCDMTGRM